MNRVLIASIALLTTCSACMLCGLPLTDQPLGSLAVIGCNAAGIGVLVTALIGMNIRSVLDTVRTILYNGAR